MDFGDDSYDRKALEKMKEKCSFCKQGNVPLVAGGTRLFICESCTKLALATFKEM